MHSWCNYFDMNIESSESSQAIILHDGVENKSTWLDKCIKEFKCQSLRIRKKKIWHEICQILAEL